MIISKPSIKIDNETAIYSSDIHFLNETHSIIFSVDKKYEDMISTSSDALLIALLIPAMAASEDIEVKGTVSKNLLYNTQSQLQEVLCEVMPGLKKVQIFVDNIIDESIKGHINHNVLSGFSAGVDAYVTLEDYFLNPKYNLKVTHFLFNNLTFKQDKVNKKSSKIKELSELYNFPLIETFTNLHFFYSYNKKLSNINFEQTHTLRNAAVAHFLGKSQTTFLYSSTYHFRHVAIKQSTDLAIVDPIILPALSSNNVRCVSVGSEYTRIEKTLKILSNKSVYQYLDLCIGKDDYYINCGICRKCKRALTLFDMKGKTHLFKNIFNLDEWAKIKKSYEEGLSIHTQLNDKELYEYICLYNKQN